MFQPVKVGHMHVSTYLPIYKTPTFVLLILDHSRVGRLLSLLWCACFNLGGGWTMLASFALFRHDLHIPVCDLFGDFPMLAHAAHFCCYCTFSHPTNLSSSKPSKHHVVASSGLPACPSHTICVEILGWQTSRFTSAYVLQPSRRMDNAHIVCSVQT